MLPFRSEGTAEHQLARNESFSANNDLTKVREAQRRFNSKGVSEKLLTILKVHPPGLSV